MAKKNGKKTGKKTGGKPVQNLAELFLFAAEDSGIAVLKEAAERAGADVQCWPEMDVLELEFGEKGSVDLEREPELWQEGPDADFLKEHKIRAVYTLTMPEALRAEALPVLEAMCQACGGAVCPDTDDFMPVEAGRLEQR